MAAVLIFVLAPPAAGLPLINVYLDGDDDIGLMSEIATAINRVAAAYPEVRGIAVVTVPMPDGVYAYAKPRLIAVNDDLTSDPSLIPSMVADDVAANFHPTLGRCTAAEFLAYHESAHIIHNARGRAEITAAVFERFGDGSSLWLVLPMYSFGYIGFINPPEALAEAFAAVTCSGGNWAEQELYHILVG